MSEQRQGIPTGHCDAVLSCRSVWWDKYQRKVEDTSLNFLVSSSLVLLMCVLL